MFCCKSVEKIILVVKGGILQRSYLNTMLVMIPGKCLLPVRIVAEACFPTPKAVVVYLSAVFPEIPCRSSYFSEEGILKNSNARCELIAKPETNELR